MEEENSLQKRAALKDDRREHPTPLPSHCFMKGCIPTPLSSRYLSIKAIGDVDHWSSFRASLVCKLFCTSFPTSIYLLLCYRDMICRTTKSCNTILTSILYITYILLKKVGNQVLPKPGTPSEH